MDVEITERIVTAARLEMDVEVEEYKSDDNVMGPNSEFSKLLTRS